MKKLVCHAVTGFAGRRAVLSAALGASLLAAAPAALSQANPRAIAPADWNRVMDAAKKEGKVVMYVTTAPPVYERLKADFDRAYPGIVLEPVRIVGAAMNTKFEQEQQIKDVDGGDAMITADVRWAIAASRRGWLKTPQGPSAATWPEAYMRAGQVAMLGVNPWVFNYNTNLVKTPLTSYQDLLKPEYAGKIGSTSLVAEVVTAWYDWLDTQHGGNFLAKLAPLNLRMYPSSVGATQATGSGEIWINAFSVLAIDKPLIAQGAPIRSVLPNPALGFSYGGAIVSWAKRPNAALVLVDYLMSPRGQTILVGDGESASPLPNIKGSLDITKLSMLDPEKYTADAIKAVETKWNGLFKTR
jgi:iron(III) transport system substrate-binding protein